MTIIPAIDILNGKCVRLSKGDYNTAKVYNAQPVEVAKRFADHGINRLHVVDLDGARSKHIVNTKALEQICTLTNLTVDFGGGLKTTEDVQTAFACGASMVNIGSVAAKNGDTFLAWLNTYGAEKVILGADCVNRKIAVAGWQAVADVDVVDYITKYAREGVTQVVCTDVAKDGMLEGPSFNLYDEIMETTNLDLIASGGVSTIDDVLRLRDQGCAGVIIGKAIYEGYITLKQLEALC